MKFEIVLTKTTLNQAMVVVEAKHLDEALELAEALPMDQVSWLRAGSDIVNANPRRAEDDWLGSTPIKSFTTVQWEGGRRQLFRLGDCEPVQSPEV